MNDVPVILAADDESHILNVVAIKLKSAGFDVLTARDGGEALEVARRAGRIDLVVTDYHMPVCDGLDLCRQLRAAGCAAPAILLTARSGNLSAPELSSCGIVQVMSKPFSPRQLLSAVQEALAARPADASAA